MKMHITEKNCRVADKVIEVLIKENCTIKEAEDILLEVLGENKASSMVQQKESYTRRVKDVLLEQKGVK